MKAFVTGGSGFVGYSVIQSLLENGYSVKAMMRGVSPTKYLSELPIEMCQADLLDKASLEKALADCDYVFHVAAHYSLWEKNDDIFYKVNVEGTKHLFEAALQQNVKKIVYTSSVAALKLSSDNTPVDETSIARAEDMIGPYKLSKFLAEVEVKKMAQDGAPITIVSPSTPVGPFDIKPTPTGKIILDFLKRKMPAYVDTGLNLVAVEDVAKGHLLALDKGKPGEVYILGGENLRLIEILKILSNISGIPYPKVRMPYFVAYSAGAVSELWARVTGGVPEIPLNGVKMSKKYMFFDTKKAIRELGYQYSSIESALERATRWFQENGYV